MPAHYQPTGLVAQSQAFWLFAGISPSVKRVHFDTRQYAPKCKFDAARSQQWMCDTTKGAALRVM